MAQVLVRIKKILFIGFVLVINTSCNNYLYNRKELENILGAKVYNYSKQYSYEESAGIQGEGFLINKYLLDNETINLFINNNDINPYFVTIPDIPELDKSKINNRLLEMAMGLNKLV